ncbi:hypothetical protein PHYC_02923 [Phycisphaerales bacterium]|nr:hypothetical protein PHYC_02923 [Phycisphaerales bacterium]
MVLVDSDVFSYFFKEDSRASLYNTDIAGKVVCLSFMSVAELKRWALSRAWGPKNNGHSPAPSGDTP